MKRYEKIMFAGLSLITAGIFIGGGAQLLMTISGGLMCGSMYLLGWLVGEF